MTESVKDSVSANAAALLIHYSFDLNGGTVDELVTAWASTYQPLWVRSAVIEALYQGRYKAVSVEQILALWLRRGQPLYHFNHEFERIVCSKFPQALVPKSSTGEAAMSSPKFPPQSHWRYLLPGASKDDNVPAAPAQESVTSVTSISVPVGIAQGEELSAFLGAEERSQSEAPLPTQPAELAPEPTLPHSSLTPSLDPVVVNAAPTAPESTPQSITPQSTTETLTETSPESFPLTNRALAQASHPVSSEVINEEPEMASEVSLDSVLAEADRLLASLTPVGTTLAKEELLATAQAKPEPIHQFVPTPEASEFYTKLKAVAQPTATPSPEHSLTRSDSLSSNESNSQRA